MTESATNLLYYEDNLDILRRYVKDETVDLVYLDPPFNSNTNYNVLFAEKDGSRAASQIQAFSDTWTWNQESESAFTEIVTAGGRVADCLQAFRTFLGECDMLAYLVMMAPRLMELRRVMKTTASVRISALRSDGEPLPEDDHGCCFRRTVLSHRNYLEKRRRV